MGTPRVTGELSAALAAELGCTTADVTRAMERLGIELRRAAAYPAKPCRGCGQPFAPRAPSHLYCAACNQT